jgi:hypothetical protein
LRDFATKVLPDAIREAMAGKLEVTFGVDCKDPKEREATREDMKFIRSLRSHARSGGEKMFMILVSVLGTGFLYWAITKMWPEGQKYFPH